MNLSNSHARTIGLLTLSLSPLLPFLTPSAQATTILGPEVHFTPDSGQPIFPAGNVNVFKQFVLDWHVNESVGDTTSVPFLGSFGADISAELEMAFGLEMGLCFGGNATFDLGFQPSITLPDRYPTEVGIPLTVNLGFKTDSSFSTTFPPLGKAYADLIMHAEADLQAQACVFGCADFGFDFSTCDIPALPDGTKLFKESVRCDPALTAKKYCAIELASFNRDDDNTARMINVAADNIAEFLAEPYLEFKAGDGDAEKKVFTADPNTDRLTVTGGFAPLYGGAAVKLSSSGTLPTPLTKDNIYYIVSPEGSSFKVALRQGSNIGFNITSAGTGTHKVEINEPEPPDEPVEGHYGSVCISVPTVNTDSEDSEFNTCEVLKSTGAEDILSVNLDVTALASDFLLPPAPFPRLADADSFGPLSYHYTIASLNIGPSVQLQTDFEMTWDVPVKEITFTRPGQPAVVQPVKMMIGGVQRTLSKLTDFAPAGTYNLTNCGPKALPLVELITATPAGAPQLPVWVTITYQLQPKLKTVVSTPFFGNLNYKALEAGVDVEYIGGLGFGPLIEGDHKFKFGEFTVYDGAPSPINTGAGQEGKIEFQMLASGPPSFAWRPSQLNPPPVPAPPVNFSRYFWSQIYNPGPNQITNWQELISFLKTSFPGMGGNTGADVKIDVTANPKDATRPQLGESLTISSLAISPTRGLEIIARSTAPTVLTVGGGLVENSGTIDVIAGSSGNASLSLNTKDAVLCGPGTVNLHGTTLGGYTGPEPSTFSNYNVITGTGQAMDLYDAAKVTAVNNMGTVIPNSALGNCDPLHLSLRFDNYPEETSWQVLNAANIVVASSNGRSYAWVADGDALVETILLPPGSYRLQVMDSANDGMCCSYGNGSYTLHQTDGTPIGSGAQFTSMSELPFTVTCNRLGLLSTSATTLINQGIFSAMPGGDGNLYGQRLDTRVDSRITANGSGSLARYYLSFQQAEHAGLIGATNGGSVHVGPFYSLSPRSTWNAGQSFTNDVGYFRSTGPGALLEIQDADMTGGCYLASGGGAITADDSTFTGSVFHIGDFNSAMIDASSGSLTLNSPANRLYTATCLSNYGTVNVPGQADFVDNVMFSNNGTIAVPAGGMLRIREKTMNTAAPGAAPETRVSPGAANATRDTLIGGTWDVTGSLYIDGAYFKAIGANAAHAATARGTVDGAGAITGALEDDATRTLSLRNAGKVWLRGANWLFPAITTLEENRGSFCLAGGAIFPRSGNSVGPFTNKGIVRIEPGSRFNVGGSYIQKSARSSTDVITGSLISSTNNFQILGGTLTANSASTVFNRSGSTIPAGTTIRVESPLIDTNEVDPFGNPLLIQERVTVNLTGVQITTIAAGANVTLHGGAVRFQAVTDNLTSNAGTFTVSGDGIDNAADVTLGTGTDDFTNTGRVNVLGSSSELFCDYIQNGAAAVTEVGGGAMLRGNNVDINAGQLIMDIESRTFDGHYATIRATNVALNNKLVINFTGKLGVPGASVDTGDTWELVLRTVGSNVTGFGSVAYTFNGGPLPADFLPPGTHLEVIQFPTSFGPRGLGLRVVPNSGFVTYDAWAASKGMPATYIRNPFQDFDNNGRTNGQEFLFGAAGPSNPANGTVRDVTGADGQPYREYLYVRAAGYHDAIYTPYASTDNVSWIKAPMLVMDISPVAGTSLERVTLRSTLPATSEPIYYRIEADFNPDNFADNSGLIPAKPITGANGLNASGYVAGQVLFFNINAPNSGNFDSIWGTNATGYGDWSGLPTACIHAGMVPVGSNGLVKVTFFPKLASYTGAPANGVTPQAPGNYPGTNDPAGVSYRIAAATAPPLVNFISSNANLYSLNTSEGTLTPEFSPAVTSYTLSVSRSVTSITLTAAPADGTASMRLNGVLPLLNGVASAPITLNAGTTVFTTTVTAQDSTTLKSYTISVSQLPADYSVTTAGNAILITDLAGFSDTLDITEPAAGSILFAAAGRSFQVNGGALRTGDSGNLTRTGVTAITVNAGTGSDIINAGGFTGTLPSLTINGGIGNDRLYFTGDITFAANASLDLDLQNDSATPGNDSFDLSQEANLLTAGTGAITVKVSRTVKLNSLASLETVNGGITMEAGLVSTSAALNAIDLDAGALRSTGTGVITLIADSMVLTGPITAGSVALRQKTNTTAIGLGTSDAAGRLGLTDIELDQITAPNLTIGDTQTPSLTLGAPITRAAATALTLVADTVAGSILPTGAGTDLDLGTGGTLTIGGPGAPLAFAISGLTPESQYPQLKVTGGVNLNGARLALTSTFAGAAGNVFTLVDNDGTDAVTGTFLGLPAGSEFAWTGSATLLGRISYTGGTGNDVTVTLVTLTTNELIARGASWKYFAPLTAAAAPALTWRNPGFAETGWLTGNAEIGYGDGDEVTPIPVTAGRPLTVYFRKTFTVANPASFSALTLSLLRDDGAVAYLNGVEVWRSSMPELTPITYATPASATAGTAAEEQTFYTRLLEPGLLVAGSNVLAVEVHQVNAGSSDISFNAGLVASPGNPDTDGDGLPDAWENTNFGNLAQSAAGDGDGDGRSNLSEWKARTNPLNSSDAFVIVSATVNATRQTTLTWPTVPGVSYRVQRSTSTNGWANIGTVLTGTGLPLSFSDAAPPAGAPRLIYRVVVP